ncbi:nitroreductase family protein [Candidatus Desantisbacteria bacterium]|nr:nitroreductase family protein [Candidatus Desantisbacteria bacterium]
METQQALITRRSIRQYTKHPIPLEVIKKIIDAARLAPTANNVQPWEFVVITNQKQLGNIADITDYGKHIARASACIAVFCKDSKYYLEDGTAATQNILISAWAEGIGSCWVAGDKKTYCQKIKQLLEVPEDYKLISLIPLGYPEKIPGTINKRGLEDVLHMEKF